MNKNLLHINQYHDEIYIKNKYDAKIIEIRYTGNIVADCLANSVVFMSHNKIMIINPKKEIRAKLLFRYYGNFKIKRIYAIQDGKMIPGAISHHFDEVEHIHSQIDTATFKYEDMNKTTKNYPALNSMLFYEFGGKKAYVSPVDKGRRITRRYAKEGAILNNLISKRGDDVVK
mgnify:FL=1|tara:strand:- start:550 stop:1068 length:519 start_codon:yes stop_codon:yes gene_type:complete